MELGKPAAARSHCSSRLVPFSSPLPSQPSADNTVSSVPILVNDKGIYLAEFDSMAFPSLSALVEVRSGAVQRVGLSFFTKMPTDQASLPFTLLSPSCSTTGMTMANCRFSCAWRTFLRHRA